MPGGHGGGAADTEAEALCENDARGEEDNAAEGVEETDALFERELNELSVRVVIEDEECSHIRKETSVNGNLTIAEE